MRAHAGQALTLTLAARGAQLICKGKLAMLTVHHLNNSRSQRVLWLCDELGLEYTLVKHQRHPETQRSLAPGDP